VQVAVDGAQDLPAAFEGLPVLDGDLGDQPGNGYECSFNQMDLLQKDALVDGNGLPANTLPPAPIRVIRFWVMPAYFVLNWPRLAAKDPLVQAAVGTEYRYCIESAQSFIGSFRITSKDP